jgi:EF hand domain-containing protein
MLTQLAALGIGLITAVGTPAVAQANCTTPSHPSAHPTAYPGYGAPRYPAPVPSYAPAPQRGRQVEPPRSVVLRRADYNNDGGITFQEAQSYARNEFGRADHDRNGVLTRYEIHRGDDLASGARSRDGVVTFAEYDASLRRQFAQLDHNRDGFVSRNELGGRRNGPNMATYSWHWKL